MKPGKISKIKSEKRVAASGETGENGGESAGETPALLGGSAGETPALRGLETAMYVYLFMAGFWLIGGIALLIWHYLDPDAPVRDLFGWGISPGWLGIFLGIFNLVRWWAIRCSARSRGFREESPPRRRHRREHSSNPPEEYNPALDFSEPEGSQESRAESQEPEVKNREPGN